MKLLDKSSIEEILMELAKLRGGQSRRKMEANGYLKKQRMIFEKMKISIPVEASMVTNRGGV